MLAQNKIYLAIFTALSLSATACNDNVEHNIQAVDSPAFVSVSPQDNIKAGLDSIIVTYDKNIFFTSSQYERITLNGQPVVSANVIGSSNKLLLMVSAQIQARHLTVDPYQWIGGCHLLAHAPHSSLLCRPSGHEDACENAARFTTISRLRGLVAVRIAIWSW